MTALAPNSLRSLKSISEILEMARNRSPNYTEVKFTCACVSGNLTLDVLITKPVSGTRKNKIKLLESW